MRKEFLLLPEDREWLTARIAELEQEIQDLGPEFHIVFNQSSETWHDNAPFDALRERQDVLSAELTHLKRVRASSLPSIPKPRSGVSSVGSHITLDSGRKLLLAGHWTHRAGQRLRDATIVSIESPIGKALLGHKIGTSTDFGKIVEIK